MHSFVIIVVLIPKWVHEHDTSPTCHCPPPPLSNGCHQTILIGCLIEWNWEFLWIFNYLNGVPDSNVGVGKASTFCLLSDTQTARADFLISL